MQALRTIFFLMVLGNLLLFAYANGYLSPPRGDGDAGRLAAQIEPQKVRVAGRGEAPAISEPLPDACRALTGVTQATAMLDLLRGRDAQLRLTQRPIVEPSSWWVFIPSQKTRRDADKKVSELKKIGLSEFFVVQESGANQFAISLGLYKSEQGARDRLDALNAKGVRSARIQVREAPTDRTLIEVRGPLDRITRALAELPAELGAVLATECAAGR